jgi:hypothetical protein
MKMIVRVDFPVEPFNTLIRKGTAAKAIQKVLEAVKPEAAYFSSLNGKRGGILIVNVKEASDIPSIAEPFFLSFNADCHFDPCMTPEDLAKSGIEKFSSW